MGIGVELALLSADAETSSIAGRSSRSSSPRTSAKSGAGHPFMHMMNVLHAVR